MVDNYDKYLLVMWKNWILLKRNPKNTIICMLLPIFITGILIILRYRIHFSYNNYATIYDPIIVFPTEDLSFEEIAYSPNNSIVNDIMLKLNKYNFTKKLVPFINAEDMNYYFLNNEKHAHKIGINFDKLLDNSRPPNNLKIILRFPALNEKHETWFTNLLFPIFIEPGPRGGKNKHSDEEPHYITRGFLTLQQALTEIIIMKYNSNEQLNYPAIKVQRYPYPPYKNDMYYSKIQSFGFVIIVSYLPMVVEIIYLISTEKGKQLMDSLVSMGMPAWIQWLAWFSTSFLLLLIPTLEIILMLKVPWSFGAILPNSNITVLFTILIFYICSMITFIFLICTLFIYPSIALEFGILFWALSYLPFFTMQKEYLVHSIAYKIASCLFANSALGWAGLLILKFEILNTGVKWQSLWQTYTPDDTLSIGILLVMFIFDSILYLGFVLYICTVIRGQYKLSHPWYFPWKGLYWFGERKQASAFEENKSLINEENFEPIPPETSSLVRIERLSKKYRNFFAVQNLNLELQKNEITVLLGHSGSGKSTVVSILVGQTPTSTGTAVILGHDIRYDINGARDCIGVCFQDNVLFNDLTIWEHLYFFGKLKRLDKYEINFEIDKVVKLLELEEKKHTTISKVSDGTKRKLAIGIALCSRAEFLIFDEPSIGIDISTRRAIWDILQMQKFGKTILLTTNLITEADLVGDKIAIITGGRLKCYGTSEFLRQKYGAGYYLTIIKNPNCKTEPITKLLERHIHEIQEDQPGKLIYLLPDKTSAKFYTMLHDLEDRSTELFIKTYGVSLASLENVYLKIEQEELSADLEEAPVHVTNEEYRTINSQPLTGLFYHTNQMRAVFIKRLGYQLNVWKIFILQLFTAIGIILLFLVIHDRKASPFYQPELTFSLNSYNNPITLISGEHNEYSNIYVKNVAYSKVFYVNDLEEYMLNLTKHQLFHVKLNYIIGASFWKNEIIAWYNGDPYHASPLSIQTILNIFYQISMGNNYTIEFANYPLPLPSDQLIYQLESNTAGFEIARLLSFAMVLITSPLVTFYVREHATKFKFLQIISSLNPITFWGVSLLCDLFCYIIIAMTVLMVLIGIASNEYHSFYQVSCIAIHLLAFGFSTILLLYLISICTKVQSQGVATALIIGIIGIVAFVVTINFKKDYELMTNLFQYIFLIFPSFALSMGIYNIDIYGSSKPMCLFLLNTNKSLSQICAKMPKCCYSLKYVTSVNTRIGQNLIVSFSTGLIILIILLFIEYKFFRKPFTFYHRQKLPKINDEPNSDVFREKQEVHKLDLNKIPSEYLIVLKDATKYYSDSIAVNGVNLRLKSYECFGLLGMNGAGKTTTLQLIVSDQYLSYGDIYVKGLNIKSSLPRKLIGYCPQFDALMDNFTPKEIIYIFCLIRGIHSKKCVVIIQSLANDLDFSKFLNKKLYYLSGETKRKLSAAIALVGDPPILVLDEPTTGMSIATQRRFWNILNGLIEEGKCIIISSNNMAESEAICTKMAILVNGELNCFGTQQYLKEKYAKGYSLILKVTTISIYPRRRISQLSLQRNIYLIQQFIEEKFPESVLKQKTREFLYYQINEFSMPLSKVFGLLEKYKNELNIEDYAIGEYNLEHVFLNFVQYQRASKLIGKRSRNAIIAHQ